ncbi:MAG: YihY/virulence factor BrkB family protein [Bacilli bacterium]
MKKGKNTRKFIIIYEFFKRISQLPVTKFLPGHMAFSLTLSIIPLLTAIFVITSAFSLQNKYIFELLNEVFDEKTVTSFQNMVQGDGTFISSILFIIISIYFASKVMRSVITASNYLYDRSYLNYIKTLLKSYFLTLILLLTFIIGTFIPLLLDVFYTIMKSIPFLGSFYTSIAGYLDTLNIIKLPIVYIYIYFSVKTMYLVTPTGGLKSKEVRIGAILVSFFWLITTYGYSFYLTNMADYSAVYGSISAIIILLLWIYSLSYIFILGLVINNQIKEQGSIFNFKKYV